jgi:nicotinate-nucleotide adenylyltransferase
MRLGLLGGSFNPIHAGHVAMARAARTALGLDRVVLVPAARPPHKQRDLSLAPAEDRLAMARLAAASEPGLDVSPIELERAGPSFTIDTVRAFLSKEPGVELYFVVGSDTVPELASWKDVRELLRLARFAVVGRAGRDLEKDFAHLEKEIGAEAVRGLRERVVPMEPSSVSATEVRARVAAGKPIDGWVPGAVADYIRSHKLYAIPPVAKNEKS